MTTKNGAFNDFYFRLIGIPLVGFLIPPIFFHNTIENTDVFWRNVGFSTFYTATYWQICRTVIVRVNHLFPNLEDNNKRLFWIFAPCFVIIIGLCNFIHLCIEPLINIPKRAVVPPILQINAASLVSFIAIAARMV